MLTALTTLLLTATHAEAQDRFWIGTNGNWADTNNWSATMNGAGGASLPNEFTTVHFSSNNQEINVYASQNVVLKNMHIGAGRVRFHLDNDLLVYGNLSASNALDIEGSGELHFKGASEHRLEVQDLIEADVYLDEGSLHLDEQLLLQNDKNLNILGEALFTNGNAIILGGINAPNSHCYFDVYGSKIIIQESANIHPSIDVNQSEQTLWISNGVDANQVQAGQLTTSYQGNRVNTCGTGPGETSFTIDAVVLSDYNGQDISCNGAEDGEAFVTVVGGVGPFTFTWIGADNTVFTQNFSDLGPGTYTVVVNDVGQGINCVDNVQITEPSPLTTFAFTQSPPSCGNICDGTGNPIIVGGVPGYTFDWSSGETTSTANLLCAGPNSLTVTDLNGCEFNANFTINFEDILANVTITDVDCFGQATGAAVSNPSGGDGGPYDFSWSTSPSTNNSIGGQSAGDITLTISDGNGCSIDTTFTIQSPDELIITEDLILNESCPESFNGSIDVSISGGVEPYNVTWTGPDGFSSNDEDISALGNGTYTLVVEDDNGCIVNQNVDVTVPDPIVIDGLVTDASCFGNSDGSIDITVSGGTPNYTILWDNGIGAVEDPSALAAGVYEVSVEDDNGCIQLATFTVGEPDELLIDGTVNNISCNNANDGSIDVEISGGTGPYITTWSGPAFVSTDEDISGLAAGTYNLSVIDDNGCTALFTGTIENPLPLAIVLDATPTSCFGANDGAIETTVTEGAESYNFVWTGPNGFNSTDEDLSSLEPGVYELEVTDDGGCIATESVEIIEPFEINVSAIITDASCFSFADGAINISMTNGTEPYTFLWEDGFGTDEDLVDIEVGDYTVTVTDFNGCQTTATFTVDQPEELDLTVTVTQISCNNANDGAIELEISGGTGPYTTPWTGPSFTSNDEDIFNLVAGDYEVQVSDQEGCFVLVAETIINPLPITISTTLSPITCNGANDASITTLVTDGVEPYTFAWTGPNAFSSTDADIFNLEPGTYELTVTDDNLCQESTTVIVEEPELLVLTSSIVDVSCEGLLDGEIDLNIVGGTPGYTISWTGPDGFISDQEDLSALAAGSYDVSVEDLNGCVQVLNAIVDEPALLEVSIDVTQISCFGADNGALDATVVGGTAPYNVLWTGPNGFSLSTDDINNLLINNLLEGVYDIIVTDDNGCEFTSSVTLTEPDEILVDIDATDPSCFGEADGSIELSITQGIAPFTVNWDNGDSGELIENLPAGDYVATITDDSGCVITLGSITLDTAPEIIIDLQGTDITCFGFDNGSIEATVTGGVAPFNFDWIGPAGFVSIDEDLSNLAAGEYILLVTDDTGCEGQANITIAEPDELLVDVLASNQLCFGELGSIDISISGGTGPYLISWTGPNGFTSSDEDLSNLEMGIYDLTIEDDNACIFNQSIELSAPEELIVNTNPIDLDCSGDDNGSIEIDIIGGTPPYFITWTADNGFSSLSEDIFNLATGTYTLTVEDDNNCIYTEDIFLFQPETFVLLSDVISPNCFGENTGSIDITLTGGDGNYNFTWTGPNGFGSNAEDLTNLFAGDYILNVTDGGGCVLDETIALLETPELVATSNVSDESCFGDENGSIDIDVSGGTPGYTFTWIGPNGFTSSDEDLNSLEAGNYDLMIEDLNGCSLELNFTVLPGLEISLDLESTNSACTLSTGSVLVNITGGAAPYNVVWNDQDFNVVGTTEEVLNLGAGVYFVQVTDDNGCLVIDGVSVSDADEITITGNLSDPLCEGDNNGAIDISPIGGTGVYTFTWTGPNGFSSTDEDIADLEAGTYAVEVVDEAGCISAEVFELLAPNVLSASASTSEITCNGANDGAIDLSISGGVAPFDVAWTGPNAFSSIDEDLSGLEAGIYDVLITDDNGCTTTLSAEITENAILDITVNAINVTCFGLNNGSIDLVISGGSAPYTFAWTGPAGFTSSNEDINNLAPGQYDLVLSDAANCVINETINIEEGQIIELQENITNVACFGDQSGEINLDVIGGNGAVSFTWTDPNGFTSSDEDLSNLFAGDYTVTASDEEGCSTEATFSVLENDELILDATITNVSCDATDDGAVDLIITGGTAPYNVVWTGPDAFASSDEDISGLVAGDYFVEIQDNLGCIASASFTVTEAIAIDLTLNGTGVVCFESNDGSIDLEISGGLAPFTILWTGPDGFSSIDEDLSGLAPGTYDLVVGDAQGCEATSSITLVESTEIIISLDENNPTCLNADGSIEATVSGGSGVYAFNWIDLDNGGLSIGNNALIENLAAGAYQVLVEDENGCEASAQLVLNDASGTVDFSLTPPLCFGGANGAIDITLSDVEAPYTVEWDGPNAFTSSDEDISDLSAGTYSVLVTDAFGCLFGEIIELTDPNQIIIQNNTNSPSCSGLNDGSIAVNVSGGTEPYTYSWIGPDGFTSNQEDITDLAPGCYTLTIEDQNLCLVQEEICIDPATEIEVLANIVTVACSVPNTGEVNIDVTGGTAPYTFAWTGPDAFTSVDEDITGLNPGEYELLLSDDNGCTFTATYTVEETAGATLTLDGDFNTCFGEATGSIDLSITDGLAPYTIVWSGPNGFSALNEDITDLEAGVYSVIVTDDQSCTSSESIEIIENPEIIISIIEDAPSCQNADGSLEAQVSGGTPGYNYFWYDLDNGNALIGNDALLENIGAGNYFLEVFDANTCLATQTLFLSDADGDLTIDVQDLSCFEAMDGSIDLTVLGVNEPYTVMWTGPNGFSSPDEDLTNLEAGEYVLQITDALGCLLGEVVTVNSPEELTATAIAGNPLCNGDVNGTIQLNILGGTEPFNVAWTGPDGFISSDVNISDLAPGCYDYIVTDENACETTGQVCIEAPDLLEINALITDVLCFGENTGVIDAVVSGGTPGFTLTWAGPDGFTSDQSFIDNLAAGQYDVSIVDVNACQLDTFIIVGQNTLLSSNALLVPPTCFEGSNGEIDLEIDGGQAPYTFEVNGPNAYFSDVEPMFSLEAGQYIVSITDDLGCFVNDTLNLIAPDSIAIVFEQNNVQCFNQNNGSIEITETTGGNGTYSYAWTGPNAFTSDQNSITDLAPGSYAVVVTDMFLCANTFEFEIEEAALLEAALDNTVDPSCVSSLDGEINISVVGGFAPYNFSWAGPDGFTSFDEDLSEVGEGAYNLLVTDDAGCTAELNSIVLLGQGDVTAFAPNDTTWCFGDPVVLTASSTTADSQGWRLEDGTQISDSAQVVIDFEPGTYVLTYFATDGPCEDSDEVEITIFDVVFADAGEDQSVFVEEIAVLGGDPSSDASATVYWSPGNLLADSTAFNPETLPMGADQEFILYAVSAGGCVTTDTVMVNIIPEISVPDGFTPNDDGMNDTWVIGNVAFYPTTTVQVYNRWGELLYESVGYTEPWDGTYEGSLLPIGTYYYVIDVREERVNTQLTGPVTIMR